MQILWCWRCEMEIPMLDEEEYSRISEIQRDCLTTAKDARRDGKTVQTVQELFAPVSEEYFRLTGVRETNANAVHHHRLSLYGPPCPACGKPFRTPLACFCAACGYKPAVAEE